MLKKQKPIFDVLFTLVLFSIFATTALLVVVIGVNVYKSTVTGMENNFTARTSLSYIAEKVRQNDVADGVELAEIGTENTPALLLKQTYGETAVETYIYLYNGNLTELLCTAGTPPDPALGQPVLALETFALSLEGSLLTVTAAGPGAEVQSLNLHLQAAGETAK